MREKVENQATTTLINHSEDKDKEQQEVYQKLIESNNGNGNGNNGETA